MPGDCVFFSMKHHYLAALTETRGFDNPQQLALSASYGQVQTEMVGVSR
jgi:hypothetical protein